MVQLEVNESYLVTLFPCSREAPARMRCQLDVNDLTLRVDVEKGDHCEESGLRLIKHLIGMLEGRNAQYESNFRNMPQGPDRPDSIRIRRGSIPASLLPYVSSGARSLLRLC